MLNFLITNEIFGRESLADIELRMIIGLFNAVRLGLMGRKMVSHFYLTRPVVTLVTMLG